MNLCATLWRIEQDDKPSQAKYLSKENGRVSCLVPATVGTRVRTAAVLKTETSEKESTISHGVGERFE